MRCSDSARGDLCDVHVVTLPASERGTHPARVSGQSSRTGFRSPHVSSPTLRARLDVSTPPTVRRYPATDDRCLRRTPPHRRRERLRRLRSHPEQLNVRSSRSPGELELIPTAVIRSPAGKRDLRPRADNAPPCRRSGIPGHRCTGTPRARDSGTRKVGHSHLVDLCGRISWQGQARWPGARFTARGPDAQAPPSARLCLPRGSGTRALRPGGCALGATSEIDDQDDHENHYERSEADVHDRSFSRVSLGGCAARPRAPWLRREPCRLPPP